MCRFKHTLECMQSVRTHMQNYIYPDEPNAHTHTRTSTLPHLSSRNLCMLIARCSHLFSISTDNAAQIHIIITMNYRYSHSHTFQPLADFIPSDCGVWAVDCWFKQPTWLVMGDSRMIRVVRSHMYDSYLRVDRFHLILSFFYTWALLLWSAAYDLYLHMIC